MKIITNELIEKFKIHLISEENIVSGAIFWTIQTLIQQEYTQWRRASVIEF